MNIAIVGGGWYGCYLGYILKKNNIKFTLYEKKDLFCESSSKNQNRLHVGFHYPRSKITRQLCINGYDKLKSMFPIGIYELYKNYYYIANDSLVDVGTFTDIYDVEGVKYERVTPDIKFNNIQGCIETNEMFIDNIEIKDFFKNELNEHIVYQSVDIKNINRNDIIIDGIHYDFLFDCTNNAFSLIKNVIYEKTISLIYKSSLNKVYGMTIMDGPFCSLYPYDIKNNKYTLTSVTHTPLCKKMTFDSEYNIDDEKLLKIKKVFEDEIKCYYDDFDMYFTYDSYFISNKVKPINKNDSRELLINKDGNIVSFCCCKISGIFDMEKYVTDLILIH
jgi:hypothetical protein